jgi:hypothetical protein
MSVSYRTVLVSMIQRMAIPSTGIERMRPNILLVKPHSGVNDLVVSD